MDRLSLIRSTIDRADQIYYNSGDAFITDAEYDALKDELRKLCPTDERLSRVGAPVSGDNMLKKVKHSRPMGSLNKITTEEELRQWCDNCGNGQVHVTYKMDGASLALYYEKGKLISAVTRGSGDEGEEILFNAVKFQGVPTTLSKPIDCSVRGECVISVEDWVKLDPTSDSNPRNFGNGIMRRKDGTQSEYLRFLAFDISNGTELKTETEKSRYLEELGFTIASDSLCANVDAIIKTLEQIRAIRQGSAIRIDDHTIWVDGAVLKQDDLSVQERLGMSSNRPKGQIAYKYESPGAETVLESVELSVGHSGAIIPVGKVRTVEIGGTNVSSVLLNNWDEINRLGVAVNDFVFVTKQGDIIPKLVSVVRQGSQRKPISEPTECPVCGQPVNRKANTDGSATAAIYCSNDECPARTSAKIKRWMNSLNILYVGDTILEAMISSGLVKEPADLYLLHNNMKQLAGLSVGNGILGDKRAESIVSEIEKKRCLTLSQFLGSLGTAFLGKRRVQIIMDNAHGKMDKLEDWRSSKLSTIPEAGVPSIADAICDGIRNCSDVIDNLLKAGVVITDSGSKEEIVTVPTGSKLSGQVIVFTGAIEKCDDSGTRYTRERMHEVTRNNGGSVGDEVNSKTTMLVVADVNTQSSKAKKARKLGTRIVAEADFWKMVD